MYHLGTFLWLMV